jgi:cell division cycle 20-like protein 1, cofactor of APC complex
MKLAKIDILFNTLYILQVTRLCDLSSDGNTVTSVSWSERGHQLAVGTHHGKNLMMMTSEFNLFMFLSPSCDNVGYVTVWDVQASKQVNINIFCIFTVKK